MKAEVLSRFHMPWLSCIALLLFMAVFIGAAIWIHRRGSKEIYRRMSDLPFDGKGENGNE